MPKNKKQKINYSGNFFVYLLECKDKTFYTGYTPDLERRIHTHNIGKGAKYTRTRLPVKLIWHKKCESLHLAMSTEYKIKQLSRKQKQLLIDGGKFIYE